VESDLRLDRSSERITGPLSLTRTQPDCRLRPARPRRRFQSTSRTRRGSAWTVTSGGSLITAKPITAVIGVRISRPCSPSHCWARGSRCTQLQVVLFRWRPAPRTPTPRCPSGRNHPVTWWFRVPPMARNALLSDLSGSNVEDRFICKLQRSAVQVDRVGDGRQEFGEAVRTQHAMVGVRRQEVAVLCR